MVKKFLENNDVPTQFKKRYLKGTLSEREFIRKAQEGLWWLEICEENLRKLREAFTNVE
jgi:hypothetical protein